MTKEWLTLNMATPRAVLIPDTSILTHLQKTGAPEPSAGLSPLGSKDRSNKKGTSVKGTD